MCAPRSRPRSRLFWALLAVFSLWCSGSSWAGDVILTEEEWSTIQTETAYLKAERTQLLEQVSELKSSREMERKGWETASMTWKDLYVTEQATSRTLTKSLIAWKIAAVVLLAASSFLGGLRVSGGP